VLSTFGMRAERPPVRLHGVGSLLDPASTSRVRDLWSRIEREFGERGVLVMPHPHVSFQVARDYDRPALEAALERFAEETAPIVIRTTGLGTFQGEWPVVFVAVEKDATLRAFQQRVWEAGLPSARGAFDYYRPDTWVPHITLAHGDEPTSVPLPSDRVERILASLASEEFRWTVSLDNLTLVWEYGTTRDPARTFPLRGAR
jgi:2'-5' RNA ligase